MTEPLLRFSPGAGSARALEFVFVGRQPLVAAAMDSAQELIAGHGAAHHLFVGERGMGKTHLVSMIAGRLAGNRLVAVARLDEDPWGIRDYRGLLASALRALRADDAGDVRALEEALTGRPTPVVLIVENLDAVFGRIGPDGRSRLRALLENSRRIVVLATASERPVYISRHAEPFFGFFDVSDLAPLSADEVQELVAKVAAYSGHPDVVEFVESDGGRRILDATHHLVGGQPRVWTILAEIATVRGLSEPAPLVRRVLDDLLPQYQDRVAALPPDQQGIVMELVEAGGALTVRQIAEHTGVDQRSVSGQLRHLSGKGWVMPAPALLIEAGGDRRSVFYELREPLVRLCLQLKSGRGVPLADALDYLQGHRRAAQPAGIIDGALRAFRATQDRAALMWLPREWRRMAQERLASADQR